MVYIYEKDGVITVTRDERPDAEQVIELDRMIPRPVRPGYDMVLRAD